MMVVKTYVKLFGMARTCGLCTYMYMFIVSVASLHFLSEYLLHLLKIIFSIQIRGVIFQTSNGWGVLFLT